VLCDCEIAVVIFTAQNKLFEYSSADVGKTVQRWQKFSDSRETRTNRDNDYVCLLLQSDRAGKSLTPVSRGNAVHVEEDGRWRWQGQLG